jgi:hypothetical protein
MLRDTERLRVLTELISYAVPVQLKIPEARPHHCNEFYLSEKRPVGGCCLMQEMLSFLARRYGCYLPSGPNFPRRWIGGQDMDIAIQSLVVSAVWAANLDMKRLYGDSRDARIGSIFVIVETELMIHNHNNKSSMLKKLRVRGASLVAPFRVQFLVSPFSSRSGDRRQRTGGFSPARQIFSWTPRFHMTRPRPGATVANF